MAKKKVGFASGIGFILAAAGSAIGLGNLWAFPYKTAKNGGAAFVFVYIACVLLIGFVTMLSEIHLGKRAHANTVSSYKNGSKNLGFFGLLALVIPFVITCYYSVLGGYTVKYTLNSFSGNAGILSTFAINKGEVILYTAIFIALAIVVIMGGVKEGIEKVSKVLMPALFIILLFVVVYSLSLGKGVKEGLEFYLKPDFKGLGFDGVLAAMGQAFFSLSLGMGIMVSYGSYTGKEVNVVKSTAMICLFDTLVAFLSGLAIFPAVAHFNPDLLEDSKSIGLIFAILPDVFDSLGTVGSIISLLFFAMVTIAALTSVISLIEVVTQFIIQNFKLPRKKSALTVALLILAVSVPIGISLGKVGILEEKGLNLFGYDLLTFLDEATNTVLMPVCALFGCIIVGWVIKPKNAIREIEEHGSKEKINPVIAALYSVMVKYITPALIAVVAIFGIIKIDFKKKHFTDIKITVNNWKIVVCAYSLLAVCAIIYFVFFRNSDTGSNDDEITVDQIESRSRYNKIEE